MSDEIQRVLDTNMWDYNPTPLHPHKWWRTIDGVAIVHGLRVWDYDLRVRTVNVEGTRYANPDHPSHKFWAGWFEMSDPNNPDARFCSSMNGERMWVRHPTTGEPA